MFHFFLAQVQVQLLLFAKTQCSEPDLGLRHGPERRPSQRWMNHCIFSLICVGELRIFPVLLFGFVPRPQCLVICYFCTGSCCLGNRWNNLREWVFDWCTTQTSFSTKLVKIPVNHTMGMLKKKQRNKVSKMQARCFTPNICCKWDKIKQLVN